MRTYFGHLTYLFNGVFGIMSLPMPKFFGSRTNRGSVGSLTVLAAIFALMAAGTAAAFFFVGCRSEEKRNARVSYWNALWNTKND
tara:strand:- start:268 stop:522 length:255 start_codon:yes stop_codon:yes gene_type:complete